MARPNSFKRLREKTGLSAAQMAKITGTPYTTWYNWESDWHTRPAPIAIAYLKLYILCQEQKRYLRTECMKSIIIE